MKPGQRRHRGGDRSVRVIVVLGVLLGLLFAVPLIVEGWRNDPTCRALGDCPGVWAKVGGTALFVVLGAGMGAVVGSFLIAGLLSILAPVGRALRWMVNRMLTPLIDRRVQEALKEHERRPGQTQDTASPEP